MQEVDQELEMLRMKKAKTLLNQQSSPDNIVEVTSAEHFDKLMKDYPDKVIIVDFWAVWCGPCAFFAPIFKKLHDEFRKEFIFAKVNVDKNAKIAMRYQITGIPTTLFVKGGKVINKIVGAMNYDGIKKVLLDLK